jgi:hypothetical protein
MKYGDGDVQWMRAGNGVIHEEMWDVDNVNERHQKIEIYQVWVNLPRKNKFEAPAVHHLRGHDMPECDLGNGVTAKVICGALAVGGGDGAVVEGPGTAIARSPVNILHLRATQAGAVAVLRHADGNGECSVTVYVRRGSLLVGEEEVRAGDVAIYRLGPAAAAAAEVFAGPDGLDALVLTGAPLNESVLMSGPLVQVRQSSARLTSSSSRFLHLITNETFLVWCRRTNRTLPAARGCSTPSGGGRTGTTRCRTTSGENTAPPCGCRTASSPTSTTTARAADRGR